MLRAINEGILIDGDIEKEIEELKEKLEDKVFFQEGTEFLIFPENKIFYPELKELLDRYGHSLFLLNSFFKLEVVVNLSSISCTP